MNPNEKDFQAKRETHDPNNPNKFPSSSRHWSNNKNPRIVRVSRTFGGKDRHSKVRTVKGLRDRRIRLSVPTAIQLYDLQDKLGLGQPSKVVDWLLDATKHDIDKLPPLPMIPGNFNLFQESSLNHNPHQMDGIEREEKNKWSISSSAQISQEFVAQNLFPLSNYHPSFPNYSHNWDPQSLSLSQFGGGYSFSTQMDQDQNISFSTSNPQLYFCPPSTNFASIIPPFPSFVTPSGNVVDHMGSQNSSLQHQNSGAPTTLHLIGSPMKSLALNVINSRTDHSGDNDNDNTRRDKGKRYS